VEAEVLSLGHIVFVDTFESGSRHDCGPVCNLQKESNFGFCIGPHLHTLLDKRSSHSIQIDHCLTCMHKG
jgi:hypothetical protein